MEVDLTRVKLSGVIDICNVEVDTYSTYVQKFPWYAKRKKNANMKQQH